MVRRRINTTRDTRRNISARLRTEKIGGAVREGDSLTPPRKVSTSRRVFFPRSLSHRFVISVISGTSKDSSEYRLALIDTSDDLEVEGRPVGNRDAHVCMLWECAFRFSLFGLDLSFSHVFRRYRRTLDHIRTQNRAPRTPQALLESEPRKAHDTEAPVYPKRSFIQKQYRTAKSQSLASRMDV